MSNEWRHVWEFEDQLLAAIIEKEKDKPKEKGDQKPDKAISGKWGYDGRSVGRSLSGDGMVRAKGSRRASGE
jgi:hypothetical protein